MGIAATERSQTMTDRVFTYVGISTMKNRTKLKYANGNIDLRIKSMERLGFTNIEFVKLPGPMNKEDAVKAEVVQDLVARHNFHLTSKTKPAAKAAKAKVAAPASEAAAEPA